MDDGPLAFAVRLNEIIAQPPNVPEQGPGSSKDDTNIQHLADASTNVAAAVSSPAISAANALPAVRKDVASPQGQRGEHAADPQEASSRPRRASLVSPTGGVLLKHETVLDASLATQTATAAPTVNSSALTNTDARSANLVDVEKAMRAEIAETNPTTLPQHPTKEISMRLDRPESPSVDIKVVDRAGSVRVAVRTADTDLAQNLQSSLSDLVHRLERKGFEAEVWAPHNSGVASSQSVSSSSEHSTLQNRGGDPRDAQQGNRGQQSDGRSRPKWVAELEQKLAAGQGM